MGNTHQKPLEKDPDSLLEQDIPTLLEWLSEISDEKAQPDSPKQSSKLKPQRKYNFSDNEIVFGLAQRLYDTDVSVEAMLNAIEYAPLRKIRDHKPTMFVSCVENVRIFVLPKQKAQHWSIRWFKSSRVL